MLSYKEMDNLAAVEIEISDRVSTEEFDATAKKLSDEAGSFSAIALMNNISMGTAEGGLELELSPRSESVKAGQEFLVDVKYRNPANAELDTVKMKISVLKPARE